MKDEWLVGRGMSSHGGISWRGSPAGWCLCIPAFATSCHGSLTLKALRGLYNSPTSFVSLTKPGNALPVGSDSFLMKAVTLVIPEIVGYLQDWKPISFVTWKPISFVTWRNSSLKLSPTSLRGENWPALWLETVEPVVELVMYHLPLDNQRGQHDWDSWIWCKTTLWPWGSGALLWDTPQGDLFSLVFPTPWWHFKGPSGCG